MLALALSFAILVQASPDTRPFLMGFTPWPADITVEGIKLSEDFAAKHGDIVSEMLMGGIPWPEAYAGKPYPKSVHDAFAKKRPKGAKLFLSISFLNDGRAGLALYRGERDNMPLPPEWKDKGFDSPETIQALKRFSLDAVEAMKPDYLAIGVELNALMTNTPSQWQAAKKLYKLTRAAVKAKHPSLPVFFTCEVNHYKGYSQGSNAALQDREVSDLMRNDADIFAMSIYPHMSYAVKRPFPASYLDFATKFGKPVAVSESGMTSRNVELKSYKLTLFGSPEEQTHFVDTLLNRAQKDKYKFVINFATTDFEKLCKKLPPPADEIASIWEFTGLQDENGVLKPAGKRWDEFFGRKWVP